MKQEINQHYSVLLEESMHALNIQQDGYYIDGTFGRGGHAAAILAGLSSQGSLLAVDKDPEAITYAENLFKNDERVSIQHGSFKSLKTFVDTLDWSGKIDGVLLDLGVSSPQLDNAQRGFSFKSDGLLDMRMDTTTGLSAAQWLEKASEQEIAKVLKDFGEERFAKRIARAIVAERAKAVITTTSRLSKIVAEANPKWEKGKDPATRSFQAIRIFINNELGDLELILDSILETLAPKGRLVIISFHSLEDRIVKRFFKKQAKGDDFPKGLPVTTSQLNPNIKIIGKAIKASKAELEKNIRSRSAIMRVAEKI
ncbi:16S rRNA (cytosine(1402)-N(4))-methyltransferase [hydrothermal vent metagenome]|uniref:16S rRNA (Cytosine(1402)-N(4))-methyltransferase n=1 Tax=hydrothermal vent metagenome TaxID=652676 RepID=A0A3B1AYS8_9ZZZZ